MPKRKMAKRRKTAERATKSTLASIPRDKKGRFAGPWLVLKTCNGPVCKADGAPKRRLTAADKDRLDNYNSVLSELEALAEASSTGNDEWKDFAEFIAFQRQNLKDGVADQYQLNDDEKAEYLNQLNKAMGKQDRMFVTNIDLGSLDPGGLDPDDVRQVNRLFGKGTVKRIQGPKIRGKKRNWYYEMQVKRSGVRVPIDHPVLVRTGWDEAILKQIKEGNSNIEVEWE